MKFTVLKRILPGVAVVMGTAAIALAPLAQADTDPLVPYGTSPQPSGLIGQHTSNHDEIDTGSGDLDLPF